jgi:hypothetical protein
MKDHLCKCGAYGTRSHNEGGTWWCFKHDPKRGAPQAVPIVVRNRPSWNPCEACDGDGCPWCQPERFGLPSRSATGKRATAIAVPAGLKARRT